MTPRSPQKPGEASLVFLRVGRVLWPESQAHALEGVLEFFCPKLEKSWTLYMHPKPLTLNTKPQALNPKPQKFGIFGVGGLSVSEFGGRCSGLVGGLFRFRAVVFPDWASSAGKPQTRPEAGIQKPTWGTRRPGTWLPERRCDASWPDRV